MRPRKKIWLRVGDRALRGEWRFILEEVWMFRVVNSEPEDFHLVLRSNDLEGDRAEIRQRIREFFAKRGPKISNRLARKQPARERLGVTRGIGATRSETLNMAVRDGAAA